jgi:hypothetical protein
VDSIFACFYLTRQLKSIQQKFQLAGVVLVVSNPHVFNLTGQLESKPPEFPTLAATDQPHQKALSLSLQVVLKLKKLSQCVTSNFPNFIKLGASINNEY